MTSTYQVPAIEDTKGGDKHMTVTNACSFILAYLIGQGEDDEYENEELFVSTMVDLSKGKHRREDLTPALGLLFLKEYVVVHEMDWEGRCRIYIDGGPRRILYLMAREMELGRAGS